MAMEYLNRNQFETTRQRMRRNRRIAISQGGVSDMFIMRDKAFDAADFFATLSMTWVVGSSQVKTFRYGKNGKLLKIIIRIVGSTVGGTVTSANLQLKLPEGLTARSEQIFLLQGAASGLPSEQVLGFIAAGGNTVTILRNSANWVLGSTTDVGGEFEIEFT